MNMQRMDNPAQRFNRLELENLWLKRLVAFVIVGIAALLFMGQAKPPDVAKVVEAQSFILRDGSGRIRARLEVVDEKLALVFQDEKGTVRASLTTIKGGEPSLNLYDEAGNAQDKHRDGNKASNGSHREGREAGVFSGIVWQGQKGNLARTG
jgi:hypothetical protein